MKGLVAVLLALVLAGLVASFYLAQPSSATPAEMTEAEKAAAVADVEELVRGIYQPLFDADAEPWMAALHPRTGPWVLGMEVGDLREIGEGVGEVWDDQENGLEYQEIDDLQVQVTLISPTVAYAVCTSPDRRWYYRDGRIDRFSTAETWVLSLTDEGWKLVAGQTATYPVGGGSDSGG